MGPYMNTSHMNMILVARFSKSPGAMSPGPAIGREVPVSVDGAPVSTESGFFAPVPGWSEKTPFLMVCLKVFRAEPSNQIHISGQNWQIRHTRNLVYVTILTILLFNVDPWCNIHHKS